MKYLALVFLFVVACKPSAQQSATNLKLLAQANLPSTLSVGEAPFGGLSGMVSLGNDEYLAISDDRSEHAPARMVKLSIALEGEELKVKPLENITLTHDGVPFKLNELDPEGITFHNKTLIISSEGSYRKELRSPPFIREFGFDGAQIRDIAFDEDRYVPEAEGQMTKGVRSNLGFESVSFSPSGKILFAVTEAALRQDAPYEYHAQNIVRLMTIDPSGKSPTKEYALKLDHIQIDGAGGVLTGENGISDIMALSEKEVLIMERAWISAAKRQIVRLYSVKLDEKAEVSGINQLAADTVVLEKDLVLDLDDLGVGLDNLEILCRGPKVDGKETLIVASDNNFSRSQTNQFFLFQILPK